MSHQHGPSADVSVRPAIEDDARAIAAIQVAAWRDSFAGVWPAAALDGLDVPTIERAWHMALTRPPTPSHRLLSACAGPVVVGFVALAPAQDEEEVGEIVALEVAPARRRDGHGSRLLSAAVDTLRQSGRASMRAWAVREDDARGDFFRSAGLAPSGLVRTVDVGGVEVAEEAWTAVL